jgi:hypothetical protein
MSRVLEGYTGRIGAVIEGCREGWRWLLRIAAGWESMAGEGFGELGCGGVLKVVSLAEG